MDSIKIKSDIILINKVPTRIATCGKHIDDNFGSKKEIILFITGNPGVTTFYDPFIKRLHNRTELPVWMIGHAGHEHPIDKPEWRLPSQKQFPQLYDVNGQIEHKLEFIKKYVPNDVQVNIVGHSVGAYIIMQLMKEPKINEQVKTVQFIFPTLEHIAKSPNGIFFTFISSYFLWLILMLSTIFTYLPDLVQNLLIGVYMWWCEVDKINLEPIKSLIDPRILNNVFTMAQDEMNVIKEREDQVLLENMHKIRIYFGENDGWNVKNTVETMNTAFPDMEIKSGVEFDHAFVLKSSDKFADFFFNSLNIN